MDKAENLNRIENAIASLSPGQVIHLGHSAIIGNFNGVRIGLDLTSTDGYVPAPFSNLCMSSDKTNPYLYPLLDVRQLIPHPSVIAKELDVLIYSHLHPDHFSVQFVNEARKSNPKLRIICPFGTRGYLTGNIPSQANSPYLFTLFADYMLKWITNGVDDFLQEIQDQSQERTQLIESIEEIKPEDLVTVQTSCGEVELQAFQVIHPASQMYIRLPEEGVAPPVIGYKIYYQYQKQTQCAILVGETATDPHILARIFEERDSLKLVCFPTTEQVQATGFKLIEELEAHASLRTLVLLERILKDETKIIPLHQGLWYFQLTSRDIVNARIALQKLYLNRRSTLPYVQLGKDFSSLRKTWEQTKFSSIKIITTIFKRWRAFQRIAGAAAALPIGANIVAFSCGETITFDGEKAHDEKNVEFAPDAIKVTLEVHLAEFDGLRNEIINAWEWQKDLIQYTLLIIGSAVTLVSTIPNLELLLLIASFMLSAIGWSYMEQSIRMTIIGRYFKSILIPRINDLIVHTAKLQTHNRLADKLNVLLWEDFFRSGSKQTVLMGFAALGKFSFAVLPGLTFVVAFIILKQQTQAGWSVLESIAVLVALCMSALPLLTALLNGRYVSTGKI